MELTIGMYGSEFDNKSKLFGICCGQMRGREYYHNAGWYNKKGEKIGWGDLDTSDIQRIAEEINDNEIFIILGERDSFWKFVTNPSIIGARASKHGDKEMFPGLEYVIEHARAFIIKNGVYYISEGGRPNEIIESKKEVIYERINIGTARKYILDFSFDRQCGSSEEDPQCYKC